MRIRESRWRPDGIFNNFISLRPSNLAAIFGNNHFNTLSVSVSIEDLFFQLTDFMAPKNSEKFGRVDIKHHIART